MTDPEEATLTWDRLPDDVDFDSNIRREPIDVSDFLFGTHGHVASPIIPMGSQDSSFV
jgi:hypothetical protein